ncbi:MAG TPA: Rho termination factor N-terminal domain-containing protein, partial [Deinococcales bacterium]|nr:Rho termination factor N-terminal domain-containing protein [Deinococcales bacterium]
MAARVGVDNYKRLRKDELVLAILERQAESEGLRLNQGYLDVAEDGYGFLQENLLTAETRS